MKEKKAKSADKECKIQKAAKIFRKSDEKFVLLGPYHSCFLKWTDFPWHWRPIHVFGASIGIVEAKLKIKT
jgi:hypothetical protein